MFARWISEDNRFAFSDRSNDGVELTDDEYAALLEGQCSGKVIVRDDSGRPVLTDAPVPTGQTAVALNTMQRDALYSQAERRIAPLQDAVDLGIATEAEVGVLVELKRYRVALSRLDMAVFPIEWPDPPSDHPESALE